MNIFKRTLNRIRAYFAKKSPAIRFVVSMAASLAINVIPLPEALKPVARSAVRSLMAACSMALALWVCYDLQPGISLTQDVVFFTTVAIVASVVEVPLLLGTAIIAVWKIRGEMKHIVALLKVKKYQQPKPVNPVQTTRLTVQTIEGEYHEVLV